MKKNIITIIALVMVLIGGLVGGYLALKGDTAMGSVGLGSEYHATSTATMADGFTVVGLRNPSAVGAQSSTSLSTLGNVVIATTPSAAFQLWDATSTTDTASTSLGIYTASAGVGLTQILDVAILRGLIVELPSSADGDVIITYR